MFPRPAPSLLLLFAISSAAVVRATYTNPDDIVYDVSIPSSAIKGDGVHRFNLSPLSYSPHREKPNVPDNHDYYLNGYTDEWHQPYANIHIEKGEMKQVSIVFPEPHSLSLPTFTTTMITVREGVKLPDKYYKTKQQRIQESPTGVDDAYEENEGVSHAERKYEQLLEESVIYGAARSDTANFFFNDAVPIMDLYETVHVILNVRPRVVTSFVYELEYIPSDVFESGELFDLTPFNSTMHMKFVIRYDSETDALGVWVVRRAPIPDFRLLVAADGQITLNEAIDHASAAGQGFPYALPKAKSQNSGKVIRFVVHFFEKTREHHVCFPIPDFFDKVVKKLTGPEGAKKVVDQPIPTLDKFALRFTNDNNQNALTVAVVQPHPISSLMISLYTNYDGSRAPKALRTGTLGVPLTENAKEDSDDDSNDDEAEKKKGSKSNKVTGDQEDDDHECPVLVFREEERQVPYIDPSQRKQFGWYSAIPMDPRKLINLADARTTGIAVRASASVSKSRSLSQDLQKKANNEARLKTLQVSACVSFNDRVGVRHPFEELADWVKDHDGDISNMEVSAPPVGISLVTPHHIPRSRHTKGGRNAVSRMDARPGTTIAGVPYRVLMTIYAVEANDWIKEVMKNASIYVTKSQELQLDVAQNQHFMLMSFYMLMQPTNAIDGINWRLFFDTIPTTAPPLTTFYTPAQLKLFEWSPLVEEHVTTLRDLMNAEYDTIRSQVGWFEDEITRERYLIARSQVENRVFNISGALVMIPVIDYLVHDDDPNVAITFNDTQQMISIVAKKEISKGASLTIDFGTTTRNKFEFFIQFGFVSRAAMDCAALKYVYTHHAKARETAGEKLVAKDRYASVLLTKTKSSRDVLIMALRQDLTARKAVANDEAPVTNAEVQAELLRYLKEQLAALPDRSSLSLSKEDGDEGEKANGCSKAFIEEQAKLLYDSHVAVLEQHIIWANSLQ